MQIRPLTNFAKRISYQSTCVKVRTSLSVVSASKTTHVADYYSEEFSILRRTKTSKSGTLSASSPPSPSKYSTSSKSFNFPSTNPSHFLKEQPHRMPIVAAVVAHRRFYPAAATTLAAGSQRSSQSHHSCSAVARFSALNILAAHHPKGPGPTSVVGSTVTGRKSSSNSGSSNNNRFAYQSGGGSTFISGSGGGDIIKGSGRPLLEVKQLGGYLNLKGNGYGFGGGKGSLLVEPPRRYYAKGKDKPKTTKTRVVVDEHEVGEVVNVDKMKAQLGKVIEEMKEDYTKQLNVRGAAGALESLEVHFDGEVYPLQELAQVGRKNPQLAVLNLASLPDAIKPVLQAIEQSGMNLNPQQEGTTLYVPLPKVTREHRETLAKNAKALFTKHKTAMQGVQNKYIKQCKNQKELSEDLVFRVSQQIMKITESYVAEAENLMHLKQKELLEK